MTYDNIIRAEFLKRLNRFAAVCRLGEEEVLVHVRNTGRCRELLLPGAEVYLQSFGNRDRKTSFTLISVKKRNMMVNIDGIAPNRVFLEGIESGKIVLPGLKEVRLVKPEAKYLNSRFDFYMESPCHKAFVEVKGVTLEDEGVAMFPDAPTERGVKHLHELMEAAKEGFKAFAVFIIQMRGMKCFKPNDKTHPQFGQALREAVGNGVTALAYECAVKKDSIEAIGEVRVILD